MSDKNSKQETSLIDKTKALRDELKEEVGHIESRLKIVESDAERLAMERNELTAKKRQLEPWLTRTEADLAKLEPNVQPSVGREEVLPTVKENRTVQKSKILDAEVKKKVKDDKKETEVKND